MNYDRVVLEMLNRISVLEEKVAALEAGGVVAENEEGDTAPVTGKKYRLLSDYLSNANTCRVSLTFDDIEEMLGFTLPPSAYTHRAFWANTTTHSIALSWMGVGYETVEVNMEEGLVVFEQKRTPGNQGPRQSKFISQAQFEIAYRSAGLWFVALYMEMFLLRTEALQDRNKRAEIIEEIYDNGNHGDKEIGGTRTRVNSLWRIIESGRALQALEIAASSERLKKENEEAAETAKDLLSRIKSGEFVLSEI